MSMPQPQQPARVRLRRTARRHCQSLVEPRAPPREQDRCRAVQRAWPRPPERYARAWHRVHAWGSLAAHRTTRVAVPRARGGFAQFFSGAHGRGEAGCSEPSPRSSFSAAIRRVPVENPLRRDEDGRAPVSKSRQSRGRLTDGIRNLPRIARRNQPLLQQIKEVRQTKTESPSGSSATTPLSLRGGSRPRCAGARPSSRASTRRSRNPASRPRSRGRSGRGGRPCPRGTRRP